MLRAGPRSPPPAQRPGHKGPSVRSRAPAPRARPAWQPLGPVLTQGCMDIYNPPGGRMFSGKPRGCEGGCVGSGPALHTRRLVPPQPSPLLQGFFPAQGVPQPFPGAVGAGVPAGGRSLLNPKGAGWLPPPSRRRCSAPCRGSKRYCLPQPRWTDILPRG